MQNLTLFTEKEKKLLLKKRKGESKFGEHTKLLNNLTNIYEDINSLDVKYVLFGIKEDIGVYANYGKTGTYNAWEAAIKVLLNTQNNSFTNADNILVLGHLDYNEQREIVSAKPKKKNISKARSLVEDIDKDVSFLVSSIIAAGKIPIIIGGGHNNAYGNIKGAALGLNSNINVVNFDAHSDFRAEEGRHSGNGFSYAFTEGFLNNYFIFGLHENYTSNNLFKNLNKIKNIKFNTFEAIEVRKEIDFKSEMKAALKHISDKNFGIEIDCDAIENISSSAMSPSGFSVNQARQFVHYFGSHNNSTYLHICEASPNEENETLVGKLISYLITDFVRANAN